MATIIGEEEVRSKSKRFVLGHICTLDDGGKIYFAKRKHRMLFRSGRKSISGAMTDQVCGWAIDEVTLYNMRAKGCTHIGVRTEDTHDLYLAPMAAWFDRKLYKDHNYDGIGRGGSRQRLLHLQHFWVAKGSVALTFTNLLNP